MASVWINIPAAIDPIDRGDRFEDPLFNAFEAEGINAEWVGGGTSLEEIEGRMTATGCDIEMEVADEDLSAALPIIRRILAAGGAPPRTTIRVFGEQEVTYRLNDDKE